ncbi:hypothetical protein Tco_0249637, partial [Tanacetum coccineum]
MIRLRAETLSTSHPLPLSTPPSGTPPLITIPLPTPSPPLLLPSTDCRSGVSKVTLPPRKRVHLHPLLDLLEVLGRIMVLLPLWMMRSDLTLREMLVMGLQTLKMRCLQDTDEIYGRLDDAQDDRSLMSGRLNMLFRDRRAHAHTSLLKEREARLSREAWGRSMDASDTARSE